MGSGQREVSFSTPGYTQVPNAILENMDLFTKAEFRVLLAAIRITIGYHRAKTRLSLTKMQRMTGLSRQSVVTASEELVARDLLSKRQDGGVTIWEIAFADELRQISFVDKADEKGDPEEDDKRASVNMYKIAKLICEATHSDWNLQSGRMFGVAKKLVQSGYKEEDVIKAFGNGGYWWKLDWRGEQGSHPTLGQITSEISGLLEKGRKVQSKVAGEVQINPDGSIG